MVPEGLGEGLVEQGPVLGTDNKAVTFRTSCLFGPAASSIVYQAYIWDVNRLRFDSGSVR